MNGWVQNTGGMMEQEIKYSEKICPSVPWIPHREALHQTQAHIMRGKQTAT